MQQPKDCTACGYLCDSTYVCRACGEVMCSSCDGWFCKLRTIAAKCFQCTLSRRKEIKNER